MRAMVRRIQKLEEITKSVDKDRFFGIVHEHNRINHTCAGWETLNLCPQYEEAKQNNILGVFTFYPKCWECPGVERGK